MQKMHAIFGRFKIVLNEAFAFARDIWCMFCMCCTCFVVLWSFKEWNHSFRISWAI